MAVTECHPFVGLHYSATTHFACHIYIANTAGHITSPTSKAASWKAQKILAEIYSPHLYASETCWSEVISHPLPFCVSCVKLANTLMTHFQNFYTCKDKPLQPSQAPVIKPNPLLLYTNWKSYNHLNQHLSQSLSKTDTRGGGGDMLTSRVLTHEQLFSTSHKQLLRAFICQKQKTIRYYLICIPLSPILLYWR